MLLLATSFINFFEKKIVKAREECLGCNFYDIQSSDEYWMWAKKNSRKHLSGCNSCVWFEFNDFMYPAKNLVNCEYTQTMLRKSLNTHLRNTKGKATILMFYYFSCCRVWECNWKANICLIYNIYYCIQLYFVVR